MIRKQGHGRVTLIGRARIHSVDYSQMRCPADLIVYVNELYYDWKAREHAPDRWRTRWDERRRWRRLGRQLLGAHNSPLRVLDVGSGTGFVPACLSPYLRAKDTLICADISREMLRVCEQNLDRIGLRCEVEYLKLDGATINVPENSVDVVTLNSVIHHVPDWETFFGETSKVLRVGGHLVMANEPNQCFYNHPFLYSNYQRVDRLITHWEQGYSHFCRWVARRAGVPSFVTRLSEPQAECTASPASAACVQQQRALCAHINHTLLDRGVLTYPLTPNDIDYLLDIHSPLSGGLLRKGEGLSLCDLLKTHLAEFELEHACTHNYIGRHSSLNVITRTYNRVLNLCYDGIGSTIDAVFCKTRVSSRGSSERGSCRTVSDAQELPRIILLVDRRGWAFDTIARAIIQRLGHRYHFMLRYSDERPVWAAEKFDLLYVFFWGDTIYRNYGIPKERIIQEVASYRWAFNEFYGLLSPESFARRFLSDCATITTPCRRLYNLLKSYVPNAFLCPNGVDVDIFHPRESRGGDLKIGWVGNPHDKTKGLHNILIPATRGRHQFTFSEGTWSQKRVSAFYGEIDVLAIASESESQPLPLMEAMASGCFIVTTDVGIVPELIVPRVNGLVVERSIGEFQRAFDWCVANLSLIRELGAANATKIQAERSWDHVAPKFATVFDTVLAKLGAGKVGTGS